MEIPSMSTSKKPRVYDLSTGTVYNTVGDFYENKNLTDDRTHLLNVEIQRRLNKVAEMRQNERYSLTVVSQRTLPTGYRVKVLPDKEAALDFVARWPRRDHSPSS